MFMCMYIKTNIDMNVVTDGDMNVCMSLNVNMIRCTDMCTCMKATIYRSRACEPSSGICTT
jgi:hypothetical protein